jgi:mono/diheme cytochrome c family protein
MKRAVLPFCLLLIGCNEEPAPMEMLGVPPDPSGIFIEPAEQRPGDPQKGYDALVNRGYVSCGIPYSIYSQFFGSAAESEKIPGRTGRNQQLPFNQTALTTAAGVEVVTANCLTCHAGNINGQLVVGLGNTEQDYTSDLSGQAKLAKSAASMFTSKPAERAELIKWADRVIAIGPYTVLSTLGVNPGDNFAAVLLAHRDPVTLAWSDTPLLELPPMIGVPLDVPPWWRMKKKNSMFYIDAGRGDHARMEMAAANLCTDNVAEAMEIDSWFPDIRAYLASIEPPKWPWAVDAARAERGKAVFESTCAKCHGTYGDKGKYQNLLIPLDVIGTDGVLALGGSQFADRFLEWWSKSFYGQASTLAPKKGYVAPPLDGIWATAPYLHNGSVPTIAALLDSKKRPQYWTRTFSSTDYDQAALGWNHTVVDHGKAGETDDSAKLRIYDTDQFGYSNKGHTFGDALSDGDRGAVLEYLKTL